LQFIFSQLSQADLSDWPEAFERVQVRLTHPKMLAEERHAIIALGVMRPHAPATLDAVSAPVGEAISAPTLLASSG
jgi:hypothetical protein